MTTTFRRLIAAGLLGVLTLGVAGCGDDDEATTTGTTEQTTGDTEATTPATPAEPALLTAKLSGKEEVPGPGVADGVGTAEITLKAGEICYDMSATMGETPTAAHIHEAAQGASGSVVVDLKPSFTNGESAFLDEGCVPADPAIISSIQKNPAGFYVNIHTAEHPNGAIRGQLGGGPAEGGTATTVTTAESGGGY